MDIVWNGQERLRISMPSMFRSMVQEITAYCKDEQTFMEIRSDKTEKYQIEPGACICPDGQSDLRVEISVLPTLRTARYSLAGVREIQIGRSQQSDTKNASGGARQTACRIAEGESFRGYMCGDSKEQNTELWSRNPKNENFYAVRLGTGDITATVCAQFAADPFSGNEDPLQTRAAELADQSKLLTDAPVVLQGQKNWVVGIVGDRKLTDQMQQNLLIRLSTLCASTDLRFWPTGLETRARSA